MTGQVSPVIRITELSLPLDSDPLALRKAIARRLKIDDADLLEFTVFKRSYDARKKSKVVLVYTVDCQVDDEAAVLAARAGDPHVRPAPDMTYRFVTRVPCDAALRARPIVVGFGPCGLFAALVLAQAMQPGGATPPLPTPAEFVAVDVPAAIGVAPQQ